MRGNGVIMNTRFYNSRIVTCNDDWQIIFGELCVIDDTISYIGSTKQEGIKYDREINLNGNLLIPGFKNAHTHSPMTFLRSFADDLPLNEWLTNLVFPMEAKLTGENIYLFSKLAILEYLTSGITSNFDMYFNVPEVMQASIDCGFRTVMCGSLNNFTDSIEKIEAYYNQYNNYHDLISFVIGFHAEYTTDINLLKGIAGLAAKYKAPVFTHNSETKAEVEGCIARHQMTPTVLFDQLGIYNYGGGGFHCVYLSDEDIDIFRKRNLTIVTNPASNLKLASGIAPIVKYCENGITIAIGTDGPASNNCLDMFREMFLVTALQKYSKEDASACPAEQVFTMATVNGAKAMGLNNCDSLAVGKKADLVVIDLNQPNMQPRHNLLKNIVYSGSKQNVKLTMVNGKILYEDGNFLNEDVEEIYAKANEMVKNLQ